jgi:O-antigen/teichoic acid export membrane protein
VSAVAPPSTVPQTGRDPKEFDKSFARSVLWTGIAKGGSQLLSWLVTFVVARLLTPEDYGILGLATVFLGIVTLLSEFGIGITIVTLRDLDRDQIAQINTVAVLLGTAGFLACCAGAIPLGWFFQSGPLPLVVLVLGTTFPISGFKVVPNALLQKNLRFKLLAGLEGVNTVIMSVSNITLAYLGFRYWTLVLGGILSVLITTALTVAYQPHSFRWPKRNTLRTALTFTRHQISGNLLWYGYSQADVVIVGRRLGTAHLGVYSLALSLAGSIPEKFTTLLTRVTPAYFSVAQNEPAVLKRFLLRLTEIISVVTFPALIGLALVADDFVRLALGAKWLEVVGPLRLLAIYSVINATSQLPPRVLTVRGQTRFLMWVGVVLAIVLPTSFLVGSRWGPTGVAAAWVIVFPLTRIPILRRVAASIDMSAKEYLGAFWPATSSSIAMTLGVLVVRALLPTAMPLGIRLLLEVLCGALVYSGVIFTCHRQRIEIRDLWLRVRS